MISLWRFHGINLMISSRILNNLTNFPVFIAQTIMTFHAIEFMNPTNQVLETRFMMADKKNRHLYMMAYEIYFGARVPEIIISIFLSANLNPGFPH